MVALWEMILSCSFPLCVHFYLLIGLFFQTINGYMHHIVWLVNLRKWLSIDLSGNDVTSFWTGLISCFVFQSWCSKWCSSLDVCLFRNRTVLSLLNLLKIYFLTCEIPERCSANFWERELFEWLCYCTLELELFGVVSGKILNTSSTEKCTMGIRTVVQMQAILLSRRSWGIEFFGVLGIFWGGWMFQLFCFWSGVMWREIILH